MSGKRKAIKIIVVILFILIAIPLIMAGLSFIGRITPDSVIPDSFDLYASVPNTARLTEHVLNHEPLPDLIALTELAPLGQALHQIQDSGLAENKLFRFAARGRLDAAFFQDGNILAAWDSGVFSPLLKFLPALAGRFTIPGLYYVQAGKNSRFEYRLGDGTVYFIGPNKNLLVISNNSITFESVIAGSSRDGDRLGSAEKNFYSKNYDIAFLLSSKTLMDTLGSADPQLLSAINLLRFSGPIEASFQFLPNQLRLSLHSRLETGSQALQKIIERDSQGASISAVIPGSAQYMTLLSMGNLKELLDAASLIAAGIPSSSGGSSRSDWENAVRRADNSARMTVGMNLDELLFSWTGKEFAVYGLEGRDNPVIAVQISDERKRKEVFDKAFTSIFVNENIRLNLDGNRIPRVQLPGFLDSLLSLMGVNVPSPYYTIHGNFLFVSESAEALLAAVNAVRRNEVLPKQELWRKLSEDNSGPSSLSIYYSLDRTLPFFLRGGSAAAAVLKSYRQGLLNLQLEKGLLSISLSVIPGAGRGLVPLTGFPLDLTSGSARTGKELHLISSGKETRLFLTRGSTVLSVNPADRGIKELAIPGSPGSGVYAIPGEGEIWAVNSQGYVNLLNKDLESQKGFPLNTGIALSAPPQEWGGMVFLSGEDASIHTVNSKAQVNSWGIVFSSPLRSPPSFLNFRNKTYVAVYPKSFFGEIYLLDSGGITLKGWPVPVSGIAFGSPLLFSAQYGDRTSRLFAAFITQAGELSVYTETAEALPGFPLELEGVFYIQPFFDGENLWIIESSGTLFRISLNGEILSHKIPRLSVKEDGYITAASIDGNKNVNIFITGEGNVLYGYSKNFTSLDGFPLPVWGKPVIADINSDKKTEVAGIGMDNKLYVWQFR